jgi:FKBP-type peptidyl-prolyl cis-trans isomerase
MTAHERRGTIGSPAVPKKNRDRRAAQRTRHRTSAAAARARQRRQRRLGIVTGSVAAIIVVAIVIALLSPGLFSKDASTTTTSSTSSTSSPTSSTTAAPLKSAAGKPCVATTGALPAGAPAVPVQTGPPPSKLVIKDLKVGTGAVVTASQTLTVDYIGVSCSTGVIFDSSYATGQPATFALSGVIPGWQQGIPGMKVGGERLLGIPAALAYGADGRAPSIAPDEPLWFVVHVISAK